VREPDDRTLPQFRGIGQGYFPVAGLEGSSRSDQNSAGGGWFFA
jgi:hypothetical protein